MAGTTVGEIRARIELDMSNWTRRQAQIRNDMAQMGRSSANLSKQMALVQKASLAVGGAVVAGIGVSVKKAADFEEAMSRVKAISGATGQDFEDLKNIAAKMGAETKYTAVEAAEGLQYLAMAGFSVKAQVGSLPAVLNLAAASGEGLGRSADIVSNIMTGFGIKAEDSGHAVDVLVKAMTTANTDLPQLGDAMKFVAPVAHSLGYSIEDTATAVAKMSDAGIQGSMAGTALRASLLHLTNPVGQSAKAMKKYGIEVKDAHGNLKPIPELVGHISKQFEGMTSAQKTAAAAQLVGVEAASGFVTLLGVGEKGLRNYSKTLKEAGGTADKVAKTQMDNLKGSFEQFTSALDGLGIAIGNEFLPTFRKIVETGTKVVEFLSELNPGIITTGIEMAGAAAAVALVASSMMKLGIAVRGLFVAMGPAGWVITGLSLLAGALVGVKAGYDQMNTVSLEAAESKQKEIDSINSLTKEFDKLQNKTKLTADEFVYYLDLNDRIKTETDANSIKRMKEEQEELRKKSGLTNEEFNRYLDLNDKVIAKAPDTAAAISEQGNAAAKNTDALKRLNKEKAEELRLELETQRAKAEANMSKYIAEEARLKEKVNALTRERSDLEQQVSDQLQVVAAKESELAAAKEAKDTARVAIAENELNLEQTKLQRLREQFSTNMENLSSKNQELQKTRENINQLDVVNQKMIDLELRQVGLNAKKGEGVRVIDKEIGRLQDAKANLKNVTNVADRKTDEYRKSVKAIDDEIANLRTARGRVADITSEAQRMNATLSKDITKRITTITSDVSMKTERAVSRGKGNEGTYHTGGVIGLGQINKLHIGGLASQFANPMSHEVDIRALRNEMVLTEAQQANLMRMIDAGHTTGLGGDSGLSSDMLRALSSIEQAIKTKGGASIIVDGYELGHVIEPHISAIQQDGLDIESLRSGR
ncbi:phage tail tape measure protein [Bacillus velezensis]|uniref:phage tail tape measure protein n=2 Tax=Bacillus velezensis TaxID=492670 RepID=UPI0003A59066|nr:phage tail tape measure protein [Bacillus velezensis]AUS16985.1 phage tail tape measure protein [Bacillus velezensis]MEC1898484.1 phage tail tape measure protein [Bacillus velezensis]MEC1918994.1 phage tail tape measure protein [Bacillus velezensis]URD65264.1 phage tail tape measure protein [Bacillus velezensis]